MFINCFSFRYPAACCGCSSFVRGTPHTVIYQPLVIGKHPAGYYVLALDEAQPRAVQSRILAVATATVLVASIVIALLMTRILNQIIIRPLNHLSGVANTLSSGQLTTRANIGSLDEVGQLGIAFNQMAANIEIRTQHLDELNQTLEARVEARTAEVQQQSTWLEAILSAAHEAIIVTDEAYKISLINQSALNIIGLTESEVLNTHLSNILAPTSEKLVDRIDDSDYGYQNEIEIKGRYYHYSISPLSKVLPNQKGDVCILADITPLRRLDALKTQVIRMASHDIRSPITSLRLQIYLLKKSIIPLTESNTTTLDRIDSTIQELTRMVNDLLDLERIERQANNICEVINMSTLLDSAVTILRTDIEAKQQKLEINFLPNLPSICGDPVQLLEVIRNLLTNAIKYTPPGGHIKIDGYRHQQHICLIFKDNGIGIGGEDIKHIFTPHFRAKTALATAEEGHGIGLSLVKAVIEQHGGEVWVESQSGLGSSFGFKLPIDISSTTAE